MKHSEQKYCMDRVTAIYHNKNSEIVTQYTKKGKELTEEARARLVRTGKVKLKPQYKNRITRYADVDDVFDFTAAGYGDQVDTKGMAKAQEELTAEYRRVKDLIMLGDSTEALELIEAFAAL